jgi:predicted transcriptional regulator
MNIRKKGDDMRVKKVRVGIKAIKTALDEFVETGKSLQNGENAKKDTGVYFTSVEAFRKVLTKRRMEVLHVIRTEKPSSLHELSRILKRDIKNVAMDVKCLTQVGFIEMRSSETVTRATTPSVNYEKIVFEISV